MDGPCPNKLARIWTAIGLIFGDGSLQGGDVQMPLTEEDAAYLSDYIVPAFLDEDDGNGNDPKLIAAQSNKHKTSYKNRKPVKTNALEFPSNVDNSALFSV